MTEAPATPNADDDVYGLRGLFDYLGERPGESFRRWRIAVIEAAQAQHALARVRSLVEVVARLQPADPDTHDRDVSWLELLEALDPSGPGLRTAGLADCSQGDLPPSGVYPPLCLVWWFDD